MIRLFPLLILMALAASPGWAQSEEGGAESSEEAIRATIEALFDGMRAGDSSAVRAVFHANARLHTALGSGDTTAVRSTPVDTFVAAVGRPHDNVWDERVWNIEIRVDGPLASAWVPYVFYHGPERSHCGVNAMQFVRGAEGWKILQITDTRHQDCEVPAAVQK